LFGCKYKPFRDPTWDDFKENKIIKRYNKHINLLTLVHFDFDSKNYSILESEHLIFYSFISYLERLFAIIT
jgi:hypothetical protein